MLAAKALLVAAALVATPALCSAQYLVSYAEFFSGAGSIYNASTAQIIEESIQEQFSNAGPSNVAVTAVDFPVDAAFTLAGVSLAQWNSIPHIQDTFEAALAGDLGLTANQVTLGDFLQQNAGMYLPFTVTGLGGNNAEALQVAQTIFNNEPGSASGLAHAMATAGIHPVNLAMAPYPLAPAWATYPSIGVLCNVTLTLPNISATEMVVSGNPNDLFTLGFLVQDLAANGLTLGPVEGGVYVVVGSLEVTTPAGVSLTPSAPIEYIASPPPPSTGTAASPPPMKAKSTTVKSSADRTVVAVSALLLTILAAFI